MRAEPGFMQYSVHRPLGDDNGLLMVIQMYASVAAYQEHSSWVRGQMPRLSELLATPPAPPVLFEPVPLGDEVAKEAPCERSAEAGRRQEPAAARSRPKRAAHDDGWSVGPGCDARRGTILRIPRQRSMRR